MKKIIINGKVISFDLEGKKNSFEAVAFENGVITATGTNEEINKLADSETEVIDAEGKTVLAGLCDSHLHICSVAEMPCSVGIYLIEPNEGESREDYVKRVTENIAKYAKDNPLAPIIRGTGWNPAAFSGPYGALPTAAELDVACSDRPVILRSYCHHFLWLNTKALEMTGIKKEDKFDDACIVERDDEGNPTGVFVDIPATEMVLDSFELADFTVEEYKQGILYFQDVYGLKNGITSAFDAMLRPNSRQAYQELADEGKLKMRVRSVFLADPTKDDSQFDEMIREKDKYDKGDMFAIDTVKFFFDGGEITSLMVDPFEEDFLKKNGYPADYKGRYFWEPERAKKIFLKLSEAGFQIHIHVMGDGAAREAIDMFEHVADNGLTNKRNVLTHIEMIKEEDIDRMAKLGVIASMQAQWGCKDSFIENYVVPTFGQERTDNSYPVGELWRRGVLCSAATDFPIDPMYSTMDNIQIGMTRSVPKAHPEYEKFKGQPLGPKDDPNKHCATLDQMLRAYTMAGAYQLFMEDYAGSLEVGKSADIVILDSDIYDVEPQDIDDIKVSKVFFKGEQVYEG